MTTTLHPLSSTQTRLHVACRPEAGMRAGVLRLLRELRVLGVAGAACSVAACSSAGAEPNLSASVAGAAPVAGGGQGGAGKSSAGGGPATLAGAGGTLGEAPSGAGNGGESNTPGGATNGGLGGSAVAGGGGAEASGGGAGVVDPGPEGDGDFEVGPNYPLDPELTDRGAPRGRMFQFTMSSSDSDFYKGDDATLNPANRHSFDRRINVYVPAAYEDGTEAPLLVIHDGPGPLERVSYALDNLTRSQDPKKRLPAFVAIAVANGGGDGKGSERGLEYDTMSDRFVRFISEEILPAVGSHGPLRQAYPNFKLTQNPEGRATMGCSSGGAAALTMGWFRPDLFRRLITYSGTFVDQQDDDAPEEETYPLGAWEYHSGLELIATAEKKPLRIFLSASDRDNGWDQPDSGHHNWLHANDYTAADLKAKGYHYRHNTALNAGHCSGKIYDLTLADTLVWTWRGYPAD